MSQTIIALLYFGIYLTISIILIIFIGKILFNNGRIFLLDTFNNDIQRADAINKLLLIGFYLVNIGFILQVISSGSLPENAIELIKKLCKKEGFTLVTLGIMHFFNLYFLNNIRKKTT